MNADWSDNLFNPPENLLEIPAKIRFSSGLIPALVPILI